MRRSEDNIILPMYIACTADCQGCRSMNSRPLGRQLDQADEWNIRVLRRAESNCFKNSQGSESHAAKVEMDKVGEEAGVRMTCIYLQASCRVICCTPQGTCSLCPQHVANNLENVPASEDPKLEHSRWPYAVVLLRDVIIGGRKPKVGGGIFFIVVG